MIHGSFFVCLAVSLAGRLKKFVKSQIAASAVVKFFFSD